MAEVPPELRARFEQAPFPNHCGFRLIEVREGYAKAGVKLRPYHSNFIGTPDGAVIMSLADYASAVAASTYAQQGVGIQFSFNIVGNTTLDGELFAEAKVVHAGRTVKVAETIVTDATGKLIARATGTSLMRSPRTG
jgi:acyl-CoA thioesterase